MLAVQYSIETATSRDNFSRGPQTSEQFVDFVLNIRRVCMLSRLYSSLSGARPPNGLPRKDGIDKHGIPDHENTVDQHMSDAFGILGRILERCAVNDARRIEDGDIGVGAHFDPPLPPHHRHSRFET